jgi:hypothetical protein
MQSPVEAHSIIGWIDERISFIENILYSTNEITAENQKQRSDSVIVLENFKYCKKLYLELLKDACNTDIKKRFRNIINKLIFDTMYELDKQEYKCISIHGVCFPSKEKESLPQENIDNINKIRTMLENVFNQAQQL